MKFFNNLSFHVLPPFVTLFVMILCYIGFYPGAMTWDSLDQLRQARLGEYADWQPPIMAFIWRQFLWVNDGPSVMLFFHMSMLYAASMFFYFWSLRNDFKFSFIFCFIPFLPWVVNFEFVIWKDVGLAYSWLLAVSIAIFYSDREKPPVMALFFVSILFIYGSLVRANSLAGAILLMPLIASCFFRRNEIKFFLIVAFLTLFSCVVLSKIINYSLSAEVRHPASYVMFDDLANLKISGASKDESIFKASDILVLKKCGLGKESQVGAPFCMNDKFEDVRKNHFQQLKAVWISTVKANPLEYLHYRFRAFLSLLRFPDEKPYYTSEYRIKDAPYTFESKFKSNSIFFGFFGKYVNSIEQVFPFIFKPYFWLFFSLILTFALHKMNEYMVKFWMLPLSGSMYTLGYFFITPAPDFRYVYWTCIISTASFMIWLVLFSNSKHSMEINLAQ